MSVLTIRRCDRCKLEITAAVEYTTVEHDGEKKDLCATCKRKLNRFMSGQELEDPPRVRPVPSRASAWAGLEIRLTGHTRSC